MCPNSPTTAKHACEVCRLWKRIIFYHTSVTRGWSKPDHECVSVYQTLFMYTLLTSTIYRVSYFVRADTMLSFHPMAELEEPVDGPQAAESLSRHLFISTDITFYFILI